MTQSHCDQVHGAASGFRLAVVANDFGPQCTCAKLGEANAIICPRGTLGTTEQAYCLRTIQGDYLQPVRGGQAKCDVCSRTAGSPGTRSVP